MTVRSKLCYEIQNMLYVCECVNRCTYACVCAPEIYGKGPRLSTYAKFSEKLTFLTP